VPELPAPRPGDHDVLTVACLVYLEQMRSTARALRNLPQPTLPPVARARLLDVFTALHGDASGSDGSAG
jgi:hypothetical protein